MKPKVKKNPKVRKNPTKKTAVKRIMKIDRRWPQAPRRPGNKSANRRTRNYRHCRHATPAVGGAQICDIEGCQQRGVLSNPPGREY
jgi:hypothetical protein